MAIVSSDFNMAAHLLSQGEIVAIPTETVYGLAANAFDENAVRKIFEIKKRPLNHPLILHCADIGQLKKYVLEIPTQAVQLMHAFSPGPITFILKKKDTIADYITANKHTVAVRIPAHPITQKLLSTIPFPLVAPSANPYGSISPTQAFHVEKFFANEIPMILDGGACSQGIESTIVGFEVNKINIYRLGTITAEDIKKVTNTETEIAIKESDVSIAPGLSLRHYAPSTHTVLSDNVQEDIRQYADKKIALLNFNKQLDIESIFIQKVLSPSSSIHEAAKNLYAYLHELDNSNAQVIIVEKLPNTPIGNALNDRLYRASVK